MAATESTDLSNPAANYERFLVDPLFRPFAAILIDEAGVAPGDALLDIACGTGIVARLALERLGPTGRVVGIDSSSGMLTIARQLEPAIDWREGNAISLPLRERECFDVVLCHHGLQFFPDRTSALREMHRALRPGGRLGIATWAAVDDGFLQDLHGIAERRLGPIIDRRHVLGDEALLRRELEQLRFREVEVRTITRRVTFPDPAIFLQLNSRAMVGMSPRTSGLSEQSRGSLIIELATESAEAARVHTTADGLTFSIGSVIATARR